MHYSRWRSTGDPTAVKKPNRVHLIDEKKPCRSCGEAKPLDRFPPSPKALHGRGSHCYDCRSLTKRAARYGIAPDEFRTLVCHTTGRIRGLLCGRCNTAIGLLREDPIIFQAAVDYLSRN